MASGVGLRSAGARKGPRSKARDLIGPALGLSSGEHPGEHRLNSRQIGAIEQLFNTHPAIQAARTILHGQLTSGGIVLRRDGEVVDLKPAFKNHLDEIWIPFAQQCVDSLLKFGYVVVSYEEDDESMSRQSIKRRRGIPGVKSEESGGKANVLKEPVNLIPIVPPTDTYEVAYVMAGRAGYHRKYLVYGMAPNMATRVDDETRVIMRQHPDAQGNVNSPMATIFDLGSFVSALTELAMTAEITNARPRIWTQMQKEGNKGGLDPQALFFDTDSRGVAASADGQDNAQQAAALATQHQLMKVINTLQTTAGASAGPDHQTNSFSGGGVATGKHSHVPPEVAPSLFTLPKGHEMANAAGQLPQSRGDLEALQRLAIEQFGAAFGVPADLMFQGRFASKSTAQLSLLNTTVSQLAKVVSRVLTMAYRDIYGEDEDAEDPAQLQLLTAPLAATEEVVNLYAAGLAPVEIAMPAVLHAIGASKDQIDKAVEQAAKDAEKKCQCDDEDRAFQKEDQQLGLEERRSSMASAPAKEKAEADQAEANVESTKAQTKKTLEEAKVAGKPQPAPASGGSKK